MKKISYSIIINEFPFSELYSKYSLNHSYSGLTKKYLILQK